MTVEQGFNLVVNLGTIVCVVIIVINIARTEYYQRRIDKNMKKLQELRRNR